MSTEVNRMCIGLLLLQLEDDFFFDENRIVRDVAMGKVVISPRIASRLFQRRRRFYDQFTSREIDLLRLFADGYQVEEIADRLGVARGTVHNTLSGVYGKLGVRGAVPAVLGAIRRGVITLLKKGTHKCASLPPAVAFS